MHSQHWILAAALGLLVVGTVSIGTSTTDDSALVVTAADGEELIVHSVDEETTIELRYTHSVEKMPVTDIYAVSDGVLVTERTEFSSFGAGLPSEATITEEGDRYVHHPETQRHETLIVRTGDIAGHELVVDGDRYALADLADGGTVRLTVERRLFH